MSEEQAPGQLFITLGPLNGASTQLADDSPAKEIISAEATDGVPGQEHDRNALEEAAPARVRE